MPYACASENQVLDANFARYPARLIMWFQMFVVIISSVCKRGINVERDFLSVDWWQSNFSRDQAAMKFEAKRSD